MVMVGSAVQGVVAGHTRAWHLAHVGCYWWQPKLSESGCYDVKLCWLAWGSIACGSMCMAMPILVLHGCEMQLILHHLGPISLE
jgi:hypothetical protein